MTSRNRRCAGSRPVKGSGYFRAKIYAKLKPFPGQLDTRKLREVFHMVLRDTVGVTDPTKVQSVLPIEDHVVPANRADVRQQGGINALFYRVPVAQHRINLTDLPVEMIVARISTKQLARLICCCQSRPSV